MNQHQPTRIELTVSDPITGEPVETTLHDLVQVLQDETGSDEDVIAVMAHMLETGRVRRRRAMPDTVAA